MSSSESSIPEWAIDLPTTCGNYFEGYVDDIEAVRQKHQASTVSTYGVRRSRINTASNGSNKTEACGDIEKENEVSINESV